MKKSNFYLLLSFALLLFFGSCSHTSQMSRIQPGKLQYAQTMPESNDKPQAMEQQKVADVQVNNANATTTTKPVAPPKFFAEKTKNLKETRVGKIVTKKVDKMYASAEEKITRNPFFEKATLKKTAPTIERSLKLGIILIVVGAILVWVLPWPLSIIGWLMEVIGVIFLLIWLLGLLDSM